MSIVADAIAAVNANPGKTASEISKLVGVKRTQYGYPTVSSALCKAAKKGLIRREGRTETGRQDMNKGVEWRYYPA